MGKITEEENNQDINNSGSTNKSTDQGSINVKANDYISLIEKAKEPFKKEILKITTKEERLIYIRQQIQKYSIMKENSMLSNLMGIFISFIVVISFILLFARTSNTLFFKSFMFAMIVVAGVTWLVLFLNMKRNNKNYSIILFALEDISGKISGSLGRDNDEIYKLKKEFKNIYEALDETKRQAKEGYAIIEQRIKDSSRRNN
ncbi:MAG: hypothetical protein Q4F66_02915 [Clostridium sp.]|nr:hypothetical protein [Clostridium sp.]